MHLKSPLITHFYIPKLRLVEINSCITHQQAQDLDLIKDAFYDIVEVLSFLL